MPIHSYASATANDPAKDVSSDRWNASHTAIKSTCTAVVSPGAAVPLTITVGASSQSLNVEVCEITCGGTTNDADLATLANGSTDGHVFDIVCVSVGASTSNTLTISGAFGNGTTSYLLPQRGTALVGCGMRVRWNNAETYWEIDRIFSVYPNTLVQVLETVGADPPLIGNKLQVYTKNIGGRLMPKWIGPSGVDTPFQPFIGMNRCAWVYGVSTASALQNVGMTMTATGTATQYTSAITSRYTAMQHNEALVTTASTSAVAGYRGAAAIYFLGNAAQMGGFFMVMRGGPATGVATANSRFFMGMGPTAAPTDVQPSSISQMIGIGYDSADTELQFMCKNSGTVVKTALNTTNFPVASFPLSANKSVPTTDRTDVYELVLFAAPNSPVINWRATDLITGAQWSGSQTAGTNAGPAVNTAFVPKIWSSAGGTSSVIGIALMSCYIETDY